MTPDPEWTDDADEIESPERAPLPESPDANHWLNVQDLTPYWSAINPDWDGDYTDDLPRWEVTILHPVECASRMPSGHAACGIGAAMDQEGLVAFGSIPEEEGMWRVRFVPTRQFLVGRIEWVDSTVR